MKSLDTSIFKNTSHSPALSTVKHAAGREVRDYCIPVNPYFPTAEMFSGFRARLEEALKYYPSYNEDIATVLGRLVGIDPAHIVMGNGSTELIAFIDLVLIKESLATPIPTFSRWTEGPEAAGKQVNYFERREVDAFQLNVNHFVRFIESTQSRAAVICNPNNPTGALLERDQVLDMLEQLKHLDVVVVDESFIDFSDEQMIPSVAQDVHRFPNAIVLKSLGKNFGLHGIRAGYCVANAKLADKLRKALPYWNTNALAEMLIRDLSKNMGAYEISRRQVVKDRIHLQSQLRGIPGLRVYPSRANFVYVRLADQFDGPSVRNTLLVDHGILVRECGNKVGSSSQFFRIAVRPPADNHALVEALRSSLSILN